jgi:hypothetical protein
MGPFDLSLVAMPSSVPISRGVYLVSEGFRDRSSARHSLLAPPNVPVHRAAANDVDFRTRAARGSVCNGLFVDHFRGETVTMPFDVTSL